MEINSVSYAPFLDEKGDFIKLTPFEKLKANITRLILTPRGTDSFDMNYGTNIRNYLFELNTETLLDEIKEDIDSALTTYEPDYKPFVTIDVQYYKPNVFNKKFIIIEIEMFNNKDDIIRVMLDSRTKKNYVMGG